VSVEAELGEIGGRTESTRQGCAPIPPTRLSLSPTRASTHLPSSGVLHANDQPHRPAGLGLIEAIQWPCWSRLFCTGPPESPTTPGGGVRVGMTKINIATHLNNVFTAAMRDYLSANPQVVDTRKYLGAGRGAVQLETARLLQLIALPDVAVCRPLLLAETQSPAHTEITLSVSLSSTASAAYPGLAGRGHLIAR